MNQSSTSTRASLQRNDAGETCIRLDVYETLDSEKSSVQSVQSFDLDQDEADSLIFELFTAVDTWRGVVRPSKPLTRVDHVLRRFGLQKG